MVHLRFRPHGNPRVEIGWPLSDDFLEEWRNSATRNHPALFTNPRKSKNFTLQKSVPETDAMRHVPPPAPNRATLTTQYGGNCQTLSASFPQKPPKRGFTFIIHSFQPVPGPRLWPGRRTGLPLAQIIGMMSPYYPHAILPPPPSGEYKSPRASQPSDPHSHRLVDRQFPAKLPRR